MRAFVWLLGARAVAARVCRRDVRRSSQVEGHVVYSVAVLGRSSVVDVLLALRCVPAAT